MRIGFRSVRDSQLTQVLHSFILFCFFSVVLSTFFFVSAFRVSQCEMCMCVQKSHKFTIDSLCAILSKCMCTLNPFKTTTSRFCMRTTYKYIRFKCFLLLQLDFHKENYSHALTTIIAPHSKCVMWYDEVKYKRREKRKNTTL